MIAEVINHELWVGSFRCSSPSLKEDREGNKVIIRKASFGPLEFYEWGIDSEGKLYEMYQWCENDLYEDDNYTKSISKEELIKEIDIMKSYIKGTEFESWNQIYDEVLLLIHG